MRKPRTSLLTWNLLKTGTLKNETEGTLMAAQDQVPRTNNLKRKVDRVFHPHVDCVEKERKQSVLCLLKIKCLHRGKTAYGGMKELVWLFIG